MANAWFLYSNEIVSGPFSTDEVKTKIDTGELPSQSFIWWKGQREWIAISTWQRDLGTILNQAKTESQKPIWYIDVGNSPVGPLTQKELINNLRATNDIGRVRLWAVGMQRWQSLFELHDVMETLGISRREYERAPLMGSVAVTRSNEDPRGFMVRAASVSEAGLGIVGEHDLRRGDEVTMVIRSSDFPTQVHARGEVVYVTESGYAGIRFSTSKGKTITPENRAVILEYVKRFNLATSEEQSAA